MWPRWYWNRLPDLQYFWKELRLPELQPLRKNIPESIIKRLLEISADEKSFKYAIPTYQIAKKLNLDDRVNTTAVRDAFVTLKDHKPNFANNPTCRLINPAKSEISKISKQILDRINKKTNENTGTNQWKNTAAVLKWFNSINNKDQYSFIAFDVVDFYLSISIDLVNAALDFAADYR